MEAPFTLGNNFMLKHQTILKTYSTKGLESTLFISLIGAQVLWQHHNQNAVIVLDDGNGDRYQTTEEIEAVLKKVGFNYALPINYTEQRIY
jgi:hypothetical protein